MTFKANFLNTVNVRKTLERQKKLNYIYLWHTHITLQVNILDNNLAGNELCTPLSTILGL